MKELLTLLSIQMHAQLLLHSPPADEQLLKTYLRVKPLLHTPHAAEAVRILGAREVEIVPPFPSSETERLFRYEQVFGPSASNIEVFEQTMTAPIANALQGYNSTVFIYGMTGAGKTYTMFNAPSELGGGTGLVGLTLRRLFEQLVVAQGKFQVALSFYEIYNENIRDLLSDSALPLAILEVPGRGVVISDLRELAVESVQRAEQLIGQGMQKRAINCTTSNQTSSRSHAVLQLTLKRYTQHQHTDQYLLQESKLFMIDLAGNEKAGLNQNKRFVQGVNINKSLLTLGKCISILAQHKKPAFIPFRDSKLTRILKDSLGGNAKTVMIACVSSESKFYEQTLNTLKYSSKAKRIKNTAKTTTKIVSRGEVPPSFINSSFSMTLEEEEHVYAFVNRMESILREKGRVETVKEELELCYYENQKAAKEGSRGENWNNNIKEIGAVLAELNEKLKATMNSMEGEIRRFVQNFGDILQSRKQEQSAELKLEMMKHNELRQQLGKQQDLIAQLQQQLALKHILPLQSHSSKDLTISLSPHDFPAHHQPQQHNPTHTHTHNALSINISSCKYSNKENQLPNAKRSATPQSHKPDKDTLTKHKKILIRPTVDTTPLFVKLPINNTQLPSPNTRSVLASKELLKQSRPSSSSVLTSVHSGQKEGFVARLRQIERNTVQLNREGAINLLEQLDAQNYELGKVEKSMVNKLRFLLKTKDLTSSERDKRPTRDKSLIKL